jgi:hypothetical protein
MSTRRVAAQRRFVLTDDDPKQFQEITGDILMQAAIDEANRATHKPKSRKHRVASYARSAFECFAGPSCRAQHASHPTASSQKRHFQRRLTALLVVLSAVMCGWMLYRRPPRYLSRQEADLRPHRFPSVEQRVKAYMSDWYLPPCSKDDTVSYQWQLGPNQTHVLLRELSANHTHRRVFSITQRVEIERVFALDRQQLHTCYKKPWSIRVYCKDSIDSILGTQNRLASKKEDPPLLAQFSDETESVAYNVDGSINVLPRIPHIKKIRKALTQGELNHKTTTFICNRESRRVDELQPIVWNLNVNRHYGMLWLVQYLDRPWEGKRDAAVFRGVLTGLIDGRSDGSIIDPHMATTDFYETCQALERCRLVYHHATSLTVDAKLTNTRDRVPDVLNGVQLTGDVLGKMELLAYKGLIILQGNDVASGLKWAMLSQSVVLMPPPTVVSYALEDLLEPFVHYIPLDETLNDIEEKVQWMIDHPQESQQISYRATLWIMDLVFHPDAAHEEQRIRQEILLRYQAHFVQAQFSL